MNYLDRSPKIGAYPSIGTCHFNNLWDNHFFCPFINNFSAFFGEIYVFDIYNMADFVQIFDRIKFLAGSKPGLVVTRGKLLQWLYWQKNLLERSTGNILEVSVNSNSICV